MSLLQLNEQLEELYYIMQILAYPRRNGLNLYEKNYLESSFIEITNPTETNIIVGCIYRHPTMDFNELSCNQL